MKVNPAEEHKVEVASIILDLTSDLVAEEIPIKANVTEATESCWLMPFYSCQCYHWY